MFRLACLTKLVAFLVLASGGTNSLATFAQQTGQQESIDRLQTIGASLSTDDQGKVIAVQFPEGVGFPPNDWHHLEQLTDLRDLDLGAIWVDNNILKHVGKLTELRSLNLFGNPFEEDALTRLRVCRILKLFISIVPFSMIKLVNRSSNLRHLNV